MVKRENSMDVETSQTAQSLEGAHLYAEEDETNLLDYFMVLVNHKMLIIGIVFFAGIAAIAINLSMTNIYRSTAIITPRGEEDISSRALSALGGLGGRQAARFGIGSAGSLLKLELVLKSHNLTRRTIEKYKLMPILFPDAWDKDSKQWTRNPPPTLQDGCITMQDLLATKVNNRNGVIEVGIEHKDPNTAKKLVEYYLAELSETLREEVLRDTAENMRFFKEQLNSTNDPLLKVRISSMLAEEIEKNTLAKAQKYYGFFVLDPPIVPDLDKKIRPNRRNNCILSVTIAFFLAIFLAFLKEYVHRLKTENQGLYQQVVQGLKSWKSKKG